MSIRQLPRVAVIALCALAQASPQSPVEPVVRTELGARLDDYLARCAAFGFSGSVLVEKGGETVLAKGYGLAERAEGRANAVDTVFDIGSLTKQFTATAILRLEQDGRLSITDTLPKFFADVPADKRGITLHHLLTHTSGLPRAHPRIASALQDRDELVRILLAAPLGSKPGARHVYSNVGYDLLGVVVELAAKTSFETYLREKLFEPAALADTTFRGDATRAARAARGHQSPPTADLPGSSLRGESQSAWDPTLATEGWYSWGLRGAGGVLTTVLDLQRWQRALTGDAILAEPARQKLFRPYRDDYACGWYILRTEKGSRWIEHGGSTDNGFDCKMGMFPDQHLVVVVLGNVGDGTVPWVNLNLGKLARGEEVAAPPRAHVLSPSELDAYVGTFTAADGARFTIESDDCGLVVSADDAAALAFVATDSGADAKRLLETSEKIASELRKGRYAALHAAEAPGRPLDYFDAWWNRLTGTHGPVSAATVLGTLTDREAGTATLIDVRFERGREILRLLWGDGRITGTRIGPPYASRHPLVPLSATRFARFDLKTSRVLLELTTVEALKEPARLLVLAAEGKKLTLRRAPR